jgi:hypothetical protein
VPYGKFPLSFVANEGQTHNRVKYISHGRDYALFLTGDELTLKLSDKKPGPKAQASIAGGRLPALSRQLLPTQSFWQWTSGAGLTTRDNAQQTTNSVLRLHLVGANRNANLVGEKELLGKANYFIGNDPKQWRTNLRTYGRVRYRRVYPGVELLCYGNQGGQLEYDFMVAPGADPKAIQLRVETGSWQAEAGNWNSEGEELRAEIVGNGDLVIRTSAGEVRFRKPTAYQPTGSKNVSDDSDFLIQRSDLLDVRYVLTTDDQIRFQLPNYDKGRPLVIDPVLVYSTYLGGSAYDSGTGIAVDSSGAAYVTGWTSSLDFPMVNPLQANCEGCSGLSSFDTFVAKLSPSGSALVYSTYLGGSGSDQGTAIAVDSAGSAYVAGLTTSTDFPVTPGAFDTTASGEPYTTPCYVGFPCAHAFVSKLKADGSALVYSTYLGGNAWDDATGIAVDSSGNAYVTGDTYTANFPTTNPIQAGAGIFVLKLNVTGTAPIYSTTLGGDSAISSTQGGVTPSSYGIAIDSSGSAYVTGFTYATDFPVTPGGFQTTAGAPCGHAPGPTPCAHAYVFKLNAAGSALVYSTYLRGSSNDYGFGIALDSSQNAYVTGSTTSTDFPTVNAFQTVNNGFLGTAFVSKLNAAGSALVYSTYLGGSSTDSGNAIAVDSFGSAYVTGPAQSTDFPTVNAIQATCSNNSYLNPAVFVTELNAAGSAPIFSTYLGCSNDVPTENGDFGAVGQAIAVDSGGNAYVTGWTGASDFSVANPLQAKLQGTQNLFVAKMSARSAGPWAAFSPSGLTFAAQKLSTTSPSQTATVSNGGTSDLRISSVAIVGADAADFAVSGDSCTAATIPASGACTVSVTFTPTTNGTRSASLNFIDNASNSLQAVALTGWSSSSFPLAVVSPASLSFGPQWAGTSSAPQPVTLSNTGNAPLLIASIAISGMFTETNNCGRSLAAGSSCTINVVFAPAEGGALPRTLDLTDDSNGLANSAQSVNLNGICQYFTMSQVTLPPYNVSPGQPASYEISVAAVGGFDHSVGFSCAITRSDASCTVSPNSLTPSSTPTNITVTVTIPASSVGGGRIPPSHPPHLPIPQSLLMLAALPAGVAWKVQAWKHVGTGRKRAALLLLAMGTLLALGLGACGGAPGGLSPVPVTTVTNYTMRVTGTATSGSITLAEWLNYVLSAS